MRLFIRTKPRKPDDMRLEIDLLILIVLLVCGAGAWTALYHRQGFIAAMLFAIGAIDTIVLLAIKKSDQAAS